MHRVFLFASVVTMIAVPAIADGSEQFRNCKACHSLISTEKIIVQGGANGPNLFGIIDRPAASLPDYNYSEGLRRAGDLGLMWTIENFIAFTANPNVFLSEHTGEDLRSKMPFGRTEGVKELARYLAELPTLSD